MIEKKIKIPIAADHGGFDLKEYIKNHLTNEGYEVIDFGTNSDTSVDYPDFIHPLADAIEEGKFEKGIIICGSGNGAQMTANKHKKIRAALCWNEEITMLARCHNDANILALPGRFIDFIQAMKMVNIFLNTDFEGGRHIHRVEKIVKQK